MYHSITFQTVPKNDKDPGVLKNTWDDWHLIPESRPLFLPPDVKTDYFDIPGVDFHGDFTEALAGEVLYKARTGSIEFIVMNGYQDWNVIYSEIMNFVHGQRFRVFLEDDLFYYYEGRISVNKWRSEKSYSRIVFDYDVSPYKIEQYSTKDGWIWDPFDFSTGVIREYKDLVVNGTLSVTVVGSRKTTIPKFIATVTGDEIIVTWSGAPGKNFSLKTCTVDNPMKFPDIKIKNNVTTMTFKGNGRVTIDYRGGSL